MPFNTKNPSKNDQKFDEALQWMHVKYNYPNSRIVHTGLTLLLRNPELDVILVDCLEAIPPLTFIYARGKEIPNDFIDEETMDIFHKHDNTVWKMDRPIWDEDGNLKAYVKPKLTPEKMKFWETSRRDLTRLREARDFGAIYIPALEMLCVVTEWKSPEECNEEF